MKSPLLILSILIFLFCLKTYAQADQTVTAGTSTTAVTYPVTGCVYNWVNDNPSIGLPASGTGDIGSFTAVNNENTAVSGNITATPVAVTNAGSGTVSEINTITNQVTYTIKVNPKPAGIVLNADGSKLFITSYNSNTVSVINTLTNAIVATSPLGIDPLGVCLSPDGNFVYIENSNSSTLSVIDTRSNILTRTIDNIPFPQSFGNFISNGKAYNGTSVKFSITVNPAASAPPTINIGAVTGTITSCAGTASARPDIQQFTVSGSNLTNDISLTAPNNFEISVSPTSGFGVNISLTQNGGSVNNTIIYVRSSAVAPSPGASGNVSVTSTGAQPAMALVTSVVNALPTVNTIAPQTVNNNQATDAISFTGTGNNFTWVNDTPGIGLAASGSGNIASFQAVNNTSQPVKATVTVLAKSPGYAYIAGGGSTGKVYVVNTADHSLVATIPVGSQPYGVVISPSGDKVYVANSLDDYVSVIDARTNKVVSTMFVGPNSVSVCLTPDGGTLYVSYKSGIVVINTATGQTITKIADQSLQQIVMSPDGKTVYAANYLLDEIDVISTATNTVINKISVGVYPRTLLLSPDGKTLYATSRAGNGSVSVVDVPSLTMIASIPVANNPYGLALTPDDKKLYVTEESSNAVAVINTSTNQVEKYITVGTSPVGASIANNGSEVFITNIGSGDVSVINTSSDQVTNTIPNIQLPFTIGNFVYQGANCTSQPVKFTITVNAAAQPTIVAGNTTGTISACLGVASVSPYIQQFTVNGSNLTADITAVPSVGFEVSLSPTGGYGTSLTIPATGGAVNNVVVYVRAAATGTSGSLTGGVNLTSPGATGNASVKGVVNSLPTMNAISPSPVYTNGQVTPGINFSANGNTVSWTNDTPGIGLPASGTGDIPAFTAINTGAGPVTAKIIATPVNATGCTGTPVSFTITVNSSIVTPAITVGPATGTISACLGVASVSPYIQQFTVDGSNLTGDIIAAATTGFEASLSPNGGYGTSITIPATGGAVNSVVVYVRAAATGTSGNLTGLVQLSSTGATSKNASVNGVVNALPTMNTISPSPVYANGQLTPGITFSANGNTVNWTNDTPGIGLPASGTGNIPTFTAINTGTGNVVANISATPVSALGCTGQPVTFTITVTPPSPPVINVAGPLSPLNTIYGTPSTAAVFNVSGTGLNSGILIVPPPGFEVSSNDITFAGVVTVSSAGTQVYIRLAAATHVGNYSGKIILSSTGAQDASIDMPASTVTPAPLLITADDKTKTAGTANPVLTASYTGLVNGDKPADLTQQPVLATIADISSPVGQYPITITGGTSPDYNITTVDAVLTVIGAIVIPNTFTPNGDGVNDTWNIKYLDSYANCTVQIFNRWGQNVYSSIGYGFPWDGRYNGSTLPGGTYYYVINLKNNTKLLSGFIAIVR